VRERVLALRPGMTSPAALTWIDEDAVLAAAADPEREYIQRILPAKLQAALDYAERASLATDIGVLWRTACALLRRGAR
jgi:lipopolysaccharide/colanic/teichoic acid biosynthesis glycosyltransferase